MKTNKVISTNTKLYEKGQKLIEAAVEFWEERQKECGPSPVVWLESDDGYFVCFTRGEYLGDIKETLESIDGEPLNDPFIFKPPNNKED